MCEEACELILTFFREKLDLDDVTIGTQLTELSAEQRAALLSFLALEQNMDLRSSTVFDLAETITKAEAAPVREMALALQEDVQRQKEAEEKIKKEKVTFLPSFVFFSSVVRKGRQIC